MTTENTQNQNFNSYYEWYRRNNLNANETIHADQNEEEDGGDFLRLFLKQPTNNSLLRHVLSQAMNETLIDRLIVMIDKYEREKDEMSCLKMLICTISPIVHAMQTSLRQYMLDEGGATDASQQNKTPGQYKYKVPLLVTSLPFYFKDLFRHLPTRQRYLSKEAQCESLYAKVCAKYFSFKQSAPQTT